MHLDVSTLGLGKNRLVALSSGRSGCSVWASVGGGGALDSGCGVSETMWTLAVTAHFVLASNNLVLANVDNLGH